MDERLDQGHGYNIINSTNTLRNNLSEGGLARNGKE